MTFCSPTAEAAGLASDVAVINALGDRHWRATASNPWAASAAYAGAQWQQDIAKRCSASGLRFEPSGRQLGARRNLVRLEPLSKISLILTRAAANSMQRRRRAAARRKVAPLLQFLPAERCCADTLEGA